MTSLECRAYLVLFRLARGLSMAGWYLRRGEKVIGPIEVAKLKEGVANGQILPTDQLAKDAAGPWTEASRTQLFAQPPQPLSQPPAVTPPPQTQLTTPPPEPQPPETSKGAVILQSGFAVFKSIGQGTLAAGGAVGRTLSTGAQRRHEIKLAKIQAKVLTDSQRIANQQANPPAVQQQPQQPIVVAPQIVQSTVVHVVNKNKVGGHAAVRVAVR